METTTVDKSSIYVKELKNKNVAKKIIVKNHYTHSWTTCTFVIGIYKRDVSVSQFFDKDDVLIGCIVYGNPVGRMVSDSISPLIKKENVIELTRLWIEDGHGKNIESYCISQSFKWIRQNKPNIKVVISYSDPEQGHVGTIYQAVGFLYQGDKIKQRESFAISLTKDPYKWMHERTVTSIYGSCGIEHLKSIIPNTFYRKKILNKRRYLYILSPKIEKKRIVKTLKHPPVDYSKSIDSIENTIEEFKK